MKMKNELLIAIFSALSLVMAGSLEAQTIGFKDGNFELAADASRVVTSIPASGATTDNPSTGWSGGTESSVLQMFLYTDAAGSPFVNGVSSGSATGGSSTALRFYDNSSDISAGGPYTVTAQFNSSTTSAIRVSFDLKFNQSWANMDSLFMRIGGGNNYSAGGVYFAGFAAGTEGTGTFRIRADDGTYASSSGTASVLSVGSWYHIVVDTSALGTSTVSRQLMVYDYNNNLVGYFSTTTGSVLTSVYDSVNFKAAGTTSEKFADLELDNFEVVAIPEPSTMILMVVMSGFLAACGYRKYRPAEKMA